MFPVLTIFGTSVYGGAVIATTLDYFFERMMMLKWVSFIDLYIYLRKVFIGCIMEASPSCGPSYKYR